MRININDDVRHTRTMKYLFGIELSMYNRTEVEKAFERLEPYYLNELWDKINVYLDDEATSDYDIKEQKDKEQPDYYYHVLVDTRNPDFEQILNTIKSSTNYVDCYQCGDVDCNYAIIRFKISIIKRVNLLLDSKYSQMYKKEELDKISKNQYIQARYKDVSTGERKISEPIRVLSKDEEAFQAMCEKYNPDEKTKSVMKQNEYDSKIDINKEIINSKTLCQK